METENMEQGLDRADGQQWRVQFDADVAFANGGGLQTQGFRLDVPGPDLGDDDIAELFVRHLGLLMVDTVRISGKRTLREPHKGGRGTGGAAAQTAGRRVVELSHPIRHGMVTLPGLPTPEISDHLSRKASRDHYAPGTEFHIGRISMVANTGTYLDSPFHRFGDGPDLAGLPLAGLVDLDGLVVRVLGAHGRAVDRDALLPYQVTGRAVLIHTGWDRHWGTDRYGSGGHPFLTAEGAAWLADQRPALVGIDSLNIDDTEDPTRPAHTTLLAAGIPVVEHLCSLEQLPVDGFRFHAAPPAIEGMGTFPIRAYAMLPGAER
ncbi:cyclase family protein [Kitasatospora acidiphila]|uniref:Cyclase family protein n=1 Tax=Kitasatospora acidiphila TaxID=2567942 RepID=A0A540W0N8_9ACTN|nr:cyclase family protein [Kitasatospora acidiphila]TQF02582.1 cyclase family protein [Kitasatospora acidiphila]